MSYAKLIDKAKKLKALADRGVGGESDSAKHFYETFLSNNNISEFEIDSENFKRTFNLADSEYEILLSNIIMSVNPFCKINRTEDHKFVVILDEEDFIEVESKFRTFHNLFKKDEDRMLYFYSKLKNEDYEKEKFIFLSGFISFHQKYFMPDMYSVYKQRGSDNNKVNPDMADKVSSVTEEKQKEENKKNYQNNKKKLDETPAPKSFNQTEIEKLVEYTEKYTPINYMRANRTLCETF